MRIESLHRWDVSPAEARDMQSRLAGQVELRDEIPLDAISTVAGIDNSYVKEGGETVGCAAVVVLTFPSLEMIETVVTWEPVHFPYVPGLLSFREAPAVLAACARVAAEPDVLLCDGQGYAHPRRLGLASHLGLVLDRPTIGCAKSRLVGRYDEPADEFGAATPLVDRDETVGMVVRSRPGHTPLFVSPGHKISVETAVAVTLACCRGNAFLPEPTRLAHELVTRERKARKAGSQRSASTAG